MGGGGGEVFWNEREERWLENPGVIEWALTWLFQQSCGPLGSPFSGPQFPSLWNGNTEVRGW